jgi:FKBP-type peptidyl-prolyl cis-trans isomerase 2
MTKVKDGSNVKVHYTGKLTDGTVFDSSEGREPLAFTIGAGMMIPGFEKGVMDMAVNEEKTINILPEDAYGEARKEMIAEVPKSQLPADMEVEKGMQLMSQTPDGQQMAVIVVDVKDDSIVVDANHALAGKELVFDIKVVEVTEGK